VTRPTIALAIGDPNGIGPEIAVKAAARLAREGGPAIVLVGDEFVVRHYVALCAGDLAVQPFDGATAAAGRLQLLAVDALPGAAFSPGTPVAAGGRATVDYVAAAMRLVDEGHAAAIVACPHSETNVNAAGIRFSGYPSLLARLKDERGRVVVPGFYDGVPELSGEAKREVESLPYDEIAEAKTFGVPALSGGESDRKPLERVWYRPTLEINGIWGGYQGKGTKTIIPSWARAKHCAIPSRTSCWMASPSI